MSIKVTKVGNDANNRILIRMNLDKLNSIEKELGKQFVAQVGILGEKAAGRLAMSKEDLRSIGGKKNTKVASESSMSNAEIGLIHEKGSKTKNIPRRSFLEIPLTTKMPALMAKIGNAILEGISKDNIVEAYKKLGVFGEGVVLRAFSSHGPGWPANSSETIRRKGSSSPLIDSGQLRASISNRVVTK